MMFNYLWFNVLNSDQLQKIQEQMTFRIISNSILFFSEHEEEEMWYKVNTSPDIRIWVVPISPTCTFVYQQPYRNIGAAVMQISGYTVTDHFLDPNITRIAICGRQIFLWRAE